MPRFILIALFALLAACGQKGPLFLPDDPKQAETSAAATPTADQNTGQEPTKDAEESDQ